LAFCILIFNIFCHVFARRAFTIVMVTETDVLRSTIDVDEDSGLVIQARSDQAAFVQLYRKHYDAIFRYCVHRLFDRTVAEDVTSELFLKMVENFCHFRGTEAQFGNWLYRIATNAVNSRLRKTSRRKNLLKSACEQATGQTNDCEEFSMKLVLLRQAMLALKPRYQTIITLGFFENMKLIEIAALLGSSPGTIRKQLARALNKLQAKMNTVGLSERQDI
jgi:RNA polymerase sigma-70 factor (ECF subfamily)